MLYDDLPPVFQCHWRMCEPLGRELISIAILADLHHTRVSVGPVLSASPHAIRTADTYLTWVRQGSTLLRSSKLQASQR